MNVDVFLIGGQSNSVGQGLSASWSPTVPSSVMQYYSGALSTANDPVGGATNSSAWPAFGLLWFNATGRKICFIPAGVNGTVQYGSSGASSWDTTGTLFATSVSLTTSALAALVASGYTPTFRGVLWCQGESDAIAINSSTETKANYKGALQTMIANYRSQYGSTMPFYMSRTGTDNTASDVGYSQIRDAQEEVAFDDPYTFIVFRDAVNFGTLHYQVQGQYNAIGYQSAQNILFGMADEMGIQAVNAGFRRFRSSITESNFYQENIYNIAGISAWQTIQTITPQKVTSIYLHGRIKAALDAGTGAVGNGSRTSEWGFTYSNGAPTVSVIGSDVTSGQSPPQFQLAVSGNNVLVQIKSNDGTHAFESGMAYIQSFLPAPGAYAFPFGWYIS